MDYYGSISELLAQGFWDEIREGLKAIELQPEGHHFDASGLRRVNLARFPFNILYVVKADRIRVQVIRHNSRRPGFGTKRKDR